MKVPLPRWKAASIGQRLAFAIGLGAVLVLLALTVAIYGTGRQLLLFQTRTEAIREVQNEVGNWDDLIDRVAMIPRAIAALETTSPGSVDSRWLARMLAECPLKAVFGIYVYRDGRDWRDAGAYAWVDRKSWPRENRISYDFHDARQDWYAGAKRMTGTSDFHVTRPYFDEGGSDIEMISVTLPLRDEHANFLGVAGVDLSLAEMRNVVRSMHIRDFGSSIFSPLMSWDAPLAFSEEASRGSQYKESSYLISAEGNVIIGPASLTRSGNKTVPSPSDPKVEEVSGKLSANGLRLTPEHLSDILNLPSGSVLAAEAGDRVIYWSQSRTTGWKLLLVVPYRMIVSPALRLAWISGLIGVAGLFLLVGVILTVSRRVSGPITRLQDAAALFERGDYEAGQASIGGIEERTDELGRFAKGFLAMASEISQREERLRNWNESLERIVRERTESLQKANDAMSGELAEAAAYASAVLPPRLAEPVSTEWVFRPSARLGGDSFGYRWLDHDTLALYLIDVCGHGVGAALLAVTVVGVLESGALPETDFTDPRAVLSGLNDAFPMERHNEMYFTAWYGVYDLKDRRIRYACGGHPPAVLLAPGERALELSASGPVIGAFPRAGFGIGEKAVPPGSVLYLFSDGAYEITLGNGAMMTYTDFRDLLAKTDCPPAPSEIMQTLENLKGESDFQDDVSILSLSFPFPPRGESAPHLS